MIQIMKIRRASKLKCSFLVLFAVSAFGTLLCPPMVSAAPILGADLASFAVLGASGVTNGGTVGSTIVGNLGSAPTSSITGNYNITSGSVNPGTEAQAQIDLDAAIKAVNAFSPSATITNGDLDAFQLLMGGKIAPGTYAVAANATNLVGNLVLDGGGSSTSVWNFLFTSALITGTSSNVTVQNVGNGANVGLYWTVGSDATLNGNTFAGNVLANGLISSDGNLTLACGRLLSANSAVTLNGDTISTSCTEALGSGGYDQGNSAGGGNGGGAPVPEPGTFLLFGAGLAGLVAFRKRSKKA